MYEKITSINNILVAWEEFIVNKKKRADVQIFSKDLLANILSLHDDLIHTTYKHAGYQCFNINDPKARVIHKAVVRDRLVHHAIYRILYPIFDEGFIFDSYSCRLDKGTHKAVRRLESFALKVSRNYTKPCYALKCDVKKFFNSVDHEILLKLISRKISDPDIIWLIEEVINSFNKSSSVQLELLDLRKANRASARERERRRPTGAVLAGHGIPIGNLTSQLFANIYLNELDQFVKHTLKIKHYLRYCDDFVILSDNQEELQTIVGSIGEFLNEHLRLKLHPNKVTIRKLKQGIDFLGYVVLPYHTVLRTKTKKRMLKRVNEKNLTSYTGLLDHCNGYKLRQKVMQKYKLIS